MPIKPTSDPASPQLMDDVTLRRKRSTLTRQLNSFIKFIDAACETDTYNPIEIEIRIQTIDSQWMHLVEIQGELEQRDGSELANAEVAERHYFSARSRAEQLLRNKRGSDSPRQQINPSPATTTYASVSSKLPELRLPTFDGTIENWPSFFDSFTSMIDLHEGLTPVQKLHYLRTALTGKAAMCIQSLATTDANYASAIEMLKRKFSCKRRILLRLCEALHNLPKINDDCPTKIGEFVALFNQHLCALRNLGEPITSWNSMLVTIITSKMSPNIIWNWELTLKDNEMLPYLDLLDFLEKRANCASAATERTTSPRRRDTTRGQVFFTNLQCPICQGGHEIRRCQHFRSQPIHERLKSVRKAALCTNCLQTGHTLQNCKSGTCRVCNKRHNTLLHQPSEEDRKAALEGSSATTSSDVTPIAM